jgi:hypothetical protein
VELVLYLPVATDPGGQGSRADIGVAGDEVDDLDGLLSFSRDRAAQLRDLGGAGDPIQDDARTALIVRRARRPWSVLTEETGGMRAQGIFFSCRYSVGMLPLTVIT